MPRKLQTAQPTFTILVANLTGGSDPSKGVSGNPVKARTGFTQQHFPEVSRNGDGRGPGTEDPSTPGLGTKQGLVDYTTPPVPVGGSATILVADDDFTAIARLSIEGFELISGEDFVVGVDVANVQSTGTVTVVANPSTATLTIGGQTLVDAGGARTSGLNDYNGTLGSPALIAADIVAAIVDGGNGFAAIATAVDAGGGVVTVTAVPVGTAGDAVTMLTSDALDITVSGANLTGGVDAEVGTETTATNLAAAINALPGFSAPAPGASTITATGPAGPGGNAVLLEAIYEGAIQNYTLTPDNGSFGSAEPTIGPPTILP